MEIWLSCLDSSWNAFNIAWLATYLWSPPPQCRPPNPERERDAHNQHTLSLCEKGYIDFFELKWMSDSMVSFVNREDVNHVSILRTLQCRCVSIGAQSLWLSVKCFPSANSRQAPLLWTWVHCEEHCLWRRQQRRNHDSSAPAFSGACGLKMKQFFVRRQGKRLCFPLLIPEVATAPSALMCLGEWVKTRGIIWLGCCRMEKKFSPGEEVTLCNHTLHEIRVRVTSRADVFLAWT